MFCRLNGGEQQSSKVLVKSYSDADWLGSSGCKSTSGGSHFLNGVPIYSSSRTQKLIALSSESEWYSMTSCAIDLLYIKALVKFVRKDADVHCKLITDNSAARQIANKLGVCRVRHLQGKLLWIQQMVQRQEFTVHQVPTKFNPADMCTKNLAFRRHCMLMFLHGMEYGDGETIYKEENRIHMTNRIVRAVGPNKAMQCNSSAHCC